MNSTSPLTAALTLIRHLRESTPRRRPIRTHLSRILRPFGCKYWNNLKDYSTAPAPVCPSPHSAYFEVQLCSASSELNDPRLDSEPRFHALGSADPNPPLQNGCIGNMCAGYGWLSGKCSSNSLNNPRV